MKRIRKALKELYAVEFVENKAQINELILSRFHLYEERESSGEPAPKKVKKPVAKRKKQVKSESTVPRTTSISSLELNLSPKLTNLLGETRLPRTQVVKRVWDYIKEHNLQNPNDRREILCDDKMSEIFGKKTTMFKLNKALSAHLYKDDE